MTGVAVSTVSPYASYRIGQHFKDLAEENKRKGITEDAKLTPSQEFAHIATHAVLGALTSAANGGNALSGAVSAGGAEYIAQVTAQTLFKKDADELTADEKQTVSSIAQIVGTVSGSLNGDTSLDAYVGNTVATNAVDNNLLSPDEWAELERLENITKTRRLTKAEAERAKFLLNKHRYSERLLAKEQNGETLSRGEQADLDNAIYEAYPDPEVANRIRNYKGPVAQNHLREFERTVDSDLAHYGSFNGQMAQSMQPVVATGFIYEFAPEIIQSMATTRLLKKHSGQQYTPDDAVDDMFWAGTIGGVSKKTVKTLDNWAKIDHTGKATGKGLPYWQRFYIDQSVNATGTGVTYTIPKDTKNGNAK